MQSSTKARWAAALWIVLAFVVWNVIFDRVLVLAGRRYAYDAFVAFTDKGQYVRIEDEMPVAVRRGVWIASGVALAIGVFGVSAVALAARRERRRHRSDA